MIFLFKIVRVAFNALGRNKMRSILTMLGIIIGVGEVIAVVSIGQGAQATIQEQIASAGSNMLFVQSGSFNRGVCLAGDVDKPELDLTGPEALDHAEVAAIISEVSGRTITFHPLNEEQMAAGARAAGIPESAIEYMKVLNGVVRAGYAAGTTRDVEQVLGRPPISFRRFAEQSRAAWLTSNNRTGEIR